ncbi:MAG: ComF family protein [Elusimicrobiales bacterium]|nr:ComF family protein [Elusimicrobiales bacterium]
MFLKEVKETLLHFLFPPVCFSCERDIPQGEKDILCIQCLSNLIYIKPLYCKLCGIKIDGGEVCYHCRKRDKKYKFEFSRSVFMYNKEISSIIIAYKYGKCDWLYKWISRKMIDKLKDYDEFKDYNFITYVPISKKKLKKRGFNQSELIARDISNETGLSLIKDAVIKIKEGKSQVDLNAKEREENVKNSFKVIKPDVIEGKDIIIIDDVATTMSTLNELAGVLKEAGAKKIACYTLARE